MGRTSTTDAAAEGGCVRVLLFASAAEAAGRAVVDVPMSPGESARTLVSRLCDVCPGLLPMSGSLLVAADHAYLRREAAVPEGAEVACFPPVAGG